MSLSEDLIIWYHRYKRDLPWRNTSNPYHIWISEVILQQTRVNQGIDYYYRFIENFPDVFALANASEDEILKVWQGLGYYSRARNLHHAAKQIVNEFNGVFPDSYKELIQLKGIGEYTAAAIASIAYQLPHAVVDGNVFRVLSRLFNIKTPINSTKGKKEYYELANKILNKNKPAAHNQALMELGAIICLPKNPLCHICCIRQNCHALQTNSQNQLPVKLKKASIKKRYFFYFFVHAKDKTIIRKRAGKDIWKGLYELPLIEMHDHISIEEAVSVFKKSMLHTEVRFTIKKFSPLHRHQLTHQLIHAYFIYIKLRTLKEFTGNNYKIISFSTISDYAYPKLISNYIDSCDFRDI
jgi:A/G-specific adenine glycosylase